jgi:MFS transporter, ACS family, glucarate transporter
MKPGEPNPFSHAARPAGARWLVFALVGAASWLLYLHRYAWGVIKPAFRAENPDLTDTEVGWLDSAFLATYAFGQVPGGVAGDVLGPGAVLGLSVLCWSLTVAALAWAAGFWLLFGTRAAFGLAQAGTYPAVSQVTRTWFPPTVRTSVQGAVTALGRLGAACAPPLVAALLMAGLGLSWRAALLATALPGLPLALAFWAAFRDGAARNVNAGRLRSARETTAAGDAPPAAAGRVALRLRGAAGVSLAVLLVYAFCSTFADMLYVFWVPSYLVEGKGMTLRDMGWFAPLPLLGGAAGGVVGGALNDLLLRLTGRPRWVRSGVAFAGKFLAAVLLLASLAAPDGRWAMVLLLGCKFFGDWSLSTQWGAITDMAGRGAGTVFGVVNTVGSLGGFAAGPALGWLKQHHGWEGLFLGVGVAYLTAAVAWLFIDCTRRVVSE